jgi:uncharacterized protein
MEPVVVFFLLGLAGGLLRTDLKFPPAFFDALSIYLLLAIGLKGGVELARHPLASVVLPAIAVLALGVVIPLLAYPVLRYAGKLPRPDAASIAAHYGSVSVVTFAVASAYLTRLNVEYEGLLTVFLVLLEAPAILVGVLLARQRDSNESLGQVTREVVLGKSVFLLLGGLVVGWVIGADNLAPFDRLFVDLFKGVLALFLLEMGLVAARHIAALRRFGLFLLVFAIVMPLLSAVLGLATAKLLGLSVGGTALLATLAASASYIAAPAAMRVAVPEANPALSLGAALGVTFPFNLIVGIPLYYQAALWLAGGST